MKQLLFIVCLFLGTIVVAKPKTLILKSPNSNIEVRIDAGSDLSYCIKYDARAILAKSKIAMILKNGMVLGKDLRIQKVKRSSNDEIVEAPFHRNTQIRDNYNQLDLRFRGNYGVIFRAYDDGVTYRFYTLIKGEIEVVDEVAEFNFSEDNECYVAYSNARSLDIPYQTSFENRYEIQKISEIDRVRPIITPLLVTSDNKRIIITESDLESYPGMFLSPKEKGFRGQFAPIPSKVEVDPVRCQEKVLEYSDLLAKTAGTRMFPWRLIAIVEEDIELPTNDLVYLLGAENRIGDCSWIKAGRVTWDWWNDWGLTGVDFETGVNTQTYKYHIDFASKNGLEYLIIDEGWYNPKNGDMMEVIPELNLEELIDYGNSKNVGIILWGVAYSFDNKLEEVCRHYSDIGIKGFKIDFMDRDDQPMVDLIYRMLDVTAKYKLVLNLHGMYKPTGLNRTYPHLLNYEGVWGLEQMKWTKEDMITYDVTMPYIRMMAGPVDYTQGAMRNATKSSYRPDWSNPMSQGTRAHQVATYIIFDSPLVMLCDSPTAYNKEKETTDYICNIPSVFEETKVLEGELGEYIVTARRAGHKWYVGGLTNWTERTVTIDLLQFKDILEDDIDKYEVSIFRDGINSKKNPIDYVVENKVVTRDQILDISLAPGGGFAIIIMPFESLD